MEHPGMSHAGNKHIRRLIWMLSVQAIKIVPRYRENVSCVPAKSPGLYKPEFRLAFSPS